MAIIQARATSTRFPNKIYEEIDGAPILFHVLNKVSLSSYVSTAVVAAPTDLEAPPNTQVFVAGPYVDEMDVLTRFVRCMARYDPNYVVRITSDCPAIDPFLIDYVVMEAVLRKADYCSNVYDPQHYTFPDGQDVEVISSMMMQYLSNMVKSKYGREHVTIDIRNNPIYSMNFNVISIENDVNYGHIKCSVDRPEDITEIEKLQLI